MASDGSTSDMIKVLCDPTKYGQPLSKEFAKIIRRETLDLSTISDKEIVEIWVSKTDDISELNTKLRKKENELSDCIEEMKRRGILF